MSALRLIVTVLVAVPLFLIVGWPHPWYVTFGIAVVSLGAGHLVDFLIRGTKPDVEGGKAEEPWAEDKPPGPPDHGNN
jgi:hypothetical protein